MALQLKEPSSSRSLTDENRMDTPYYNSSAGSAGGQSPYGGQNPYGNANPGSFNGNLDNPISGTQYFSNDTYGDLAPINLSNPTVPVDEGKRKMIIIIISAVAGIILFAAAFWFFTEQPWRKGGIKDISDADQVIQSFMDALLSGDMEQISDFYDEYTPKEISSKIKKTPTYAELTTLEEGMKSLMATGVKIDLTYSTFYKTRLTDIQQDDLKSQAKAIDSDLSFKDAYYVDVPFKMTVSYAGVSKAQDYKFRFTFIRIGKRWYIFDATRAQ